ncbi:Myb DNA-bind 5 and/or MADF DNA bdg domain containing protein [Asbolus verrucosus]|uniref:Regulatory protein zeste n=1 Tax=Asbolus verrucosus TaxID=1661398 RepID=A0A482VSR1_ASBVE|nr:Myb DNA-bind 5 and/or MADF DNA bdg domain containing protein [Asbolus verrucosus]
MMKEKLEDPEDTWTLANTSLPPPGPGNGQPPAKKKKYKSYAVALENISDGEVHPLLSSKTKDKQYYFAAALKRAISPPGIPGPFWTKIRSKNVTSTEITIMVEEVERRRNVLLGPLKGPRLTQFHRDRAWEKVVEAVNAVAPVVRGLPEIKKKIRDLKTQTKQKANAFKREARKTGGGENDAVPLSAAEQRALSFIGNDNIEGIEGGVDTFRKEGKYF